MIKRDEIDSLRRILLIENFHFREDFFRHILHHSGVVPDTVKDLQDRLPHGPAVNAGIHIVTCGGRNPQPITRKIHRPLNGNILLRVNILHIGQTHLGWIVFPIRLDADFLSKPLRTVLGDSGLGQLVTEFQLKFIARQSIAKLSMRNIKLPLKIALLLDIRWCREDKSQFIYVCQFFFQCFIGVNGKICRYYRHFCPAFYSLPKFIYDPALLLII